MAAEKQPRFAAVDAAFLIALAAGDEACDAAVDFLGRLRLFIFVSPATCQALSDVAACSTDPRIRELAATALRSLGTWGFWTDGLTDVQHFIATEAAKRVETALGLTFTQSRMIAECAVGNTAVLLSDDDLLSRIDSKFLDLVLLDRELSGFPIFDPGNFSTAAEMVFSGRSR
jgi:hypothetical protein